MSSHSNRVASNIEVVGDGSTSIDNDIQEVECKQPSRIHISRSSAGSTSSNGTAITTGTKRQKDISPCYVCGAKANGYNFDQITCESCKAFFRRNALKSMEKFRCRNNDNCVVTSVTRKRCKRCRLAKCFKVGMRKEWILTDEEKSIKRQKIVRNRLIKQQALLGLQSKTTDLSQTSIQTSEKASSKAEPSTSRAMSIMHMKHSPDQKLYERQQYLLEKLAQGYQLITKQYPQPHKFAYRNKLIYDTENFDEKLLLTKDLTRELTQMTTLRLLNYFNLIPEFQLLTPQEKRAILTQNMLTVFMFHGALTYNPENDTCVDRTTGDDPYDAKYLLYVYGQRIYNDFVKLAQGFFSVTYQLLDEKQSEEQSHKLSLLLMAILLFSNSSQGNKGEDDQSKLTKIQQSYIDTAYRFLHDHFGVTIARKIFEKLSPLFIDLQRLTSTLANVNLCEMAEDDDRSSSSSRVPVTATTTATRATTTVMTYNSEAQSTYPSLPTTSSSLEFDSTMISGRSHLNELQKENRAPPPPSVAVPMSSSSVNSASISPTLRSSPSVLTNTITTVHNYQV